MADPSPPPSELDQLRQEQTELKREVTRLRQQLAEAGQTAARRDEAKAAENFSHAAELAASSARTAAAEVDAGAAWRRAAELGASLGQRIAEGQARLIASQSAVTALESANVGLVASRAAIALREADLRALIESAIDCAIITTDCDGLVLAWNSGARHLLGWDEAGALAMDLHAVVPPAEGEGETLAADITAALSGTRVSREGWLLRQDGSRVWAGIEAMAVHADRADRSVCVLWMLRDRSAARRHEAALRESEARHRLLVESWAQATWETDGNGDVVADSPSWRAYTGQTLEKMLGYGWLDAIHPDDRSYAERQWREAVAARRLINAEFRLRAPLGGWRWTNVRAAPVTNAAAKVEKWVGMNIDIDARKTAERALAESEERFRGFAENSADVLWITNRDGSRLDYLSPAFDQVFGEPRDRILADLGHFLKLVHPEDRDAVAGLMPRTLAGETVIAQYRVVRPSDGRIVHLRDTGFPIRDADGMVTHAAGVVQDLSDLHDATAAVEAEKERFRTLVEGLPELVWRAVDQGSWTWASPQWKAYTGQDDAASRGSGWLDALHPADRATAERAWEEAEALGLFQADFRLRHAGAGNYGWFQTRGVPLHGADGTIIEWIGACANIDDQMRAREMLARNAEELDARVQERTAELMAAEATLRQAQKMEAIGQLTGGIAHDFSNMLQGVISGIELARRRMDQGRTAEVAQLTEAAREAALRAAGLTRRLLAFARHQQLEPRPVDADALVGGMEELLRRSVGPSVTVDLQLCDGAGRIICDPSELESAVLNLCINARDAMPDGGRLTITTDDVQIAAAELQPDEAVDPGDFVSIRVADSGTGMTPEVMERVLEPFFTTKPQGKGTGLGLSQVYGFVRQSGGVLRLESALGHGTTVQILLPRAKVAEAATRADASGETVARSARGENILLVDDEAVVRAPAAGRLRDLGYRVVEAASGPAALQLLEEGLRPDILVTDVGLPGGMDGRALAERVREERRGLPVVFVTGYAHVALPKDAVVVTKPFDLDTLAARVAWALRRGG